MSFTSIVRKMFESRTQKIELNHFSFFCTMKWILTIVLLSSIVSSCTYKEAAEFIPPPPIDSVSYKNDIVPILQTSCYGPGYPDPNNGPTCHFCPSTYPAPTCYNDYSGLKTEVDNGQLYLHVLSPNADMPKFPVPPLSPTDTAKIATWVREGAPNN